MLVAIEEKLDKYIRPVLAQDGGNIEVIEYSENSLRMRLMGQCSVCPLSSQTIETVIKAKIQEHLPEIREIVVETGLSEELLDIAKLYLRRND